MMRKFLNMLLIAIGVVAYGQPSGSCKSGTIRLGTDGKLYGCVETGWKKLSEDFIANLTYGVQDGHTFLFKNDIYVKELGYIYQLKNTGYIPINIPNETHSVGKIIYSTNNKHFYQAVENGKWHQIDNEDNFVPSEKCLSMVPDLKYGDGMHDFIYCEMKAEDGRIWLNNNLGAEYSRVGSPVFNPSRQAVRGDWEDPNARGSLFMYGRDSDGHELVRWTSKESYELLYPSIPSDYDTSLYYEICPTGFRTPTKAEVSNLVTILRELHPGEFNTSVLGFVSVITNSEIAIENGYIEGYWTYTDEPFMKWIPYNPFVIFLQKRRIDERGAIRCIKNN
ncbi:hypothetical protein [Bergeyella sp. RCAD1439]|uniref:hypothetical protein n=1 Tax=Bergeyella anatis TaxID=3113737 RepID=UPI002E18C865|nr:hypothetical protein [Bergeyella sp. RCAD1439]